MIVDPKARFNRTGQVIGRDRSSDWLGARASRRSEREARDRLSDNDLQNLRAFTRCGRDARAPSNHLTGLDKI